MFIHTFQKRIRYGETDRMGYLYYGNYALLYEIGRSEAIRSLGISYKALEDDFKIMMPVIYVESKYKMPVKYDELISIETRIEEPPSKLIRFDHTIFDEEGKVVHEGVVKLFFVSMETGKRVSAPAYLTDKLSESFD